MICKQCNQEFNSKRADAKFCSVSCRKKASRNVTDNSVTDNSVTDNSVTDNSTKTSTSWIDRRIAELEKEISLL